MRRMLPVVALALMGTVHGASGVEPAPGAVAAAGSLGFTAVALEASHFQAAPVACIPEDPSCPPFGAIVTANDIGETRQGTIVCLWIDGGEAFMGINFGSADFPVTAAAYAANHGGMAPTFALIEHAEARCHDPRLQHRLRVAASPLMGTVAVVEPCEHLVCADG